MNISQSIINLIESERVAQDAQWGGPEHDDKHDVMDFMEFVSSQVEKFAHGLIKQGDKYQSTPDCRQRYVKIAAICVAALESMDRRNSGK